MKLNKYILLLLFLTASMQILQAQEGDYMKMRAKLAVLGCGDFDTATLFIAHRKLIKVDTNTITANRNEYFKDLGMSYFNLAGKTKDSTMMEYAAYNFKRAWQLNNKDFMSLWNACCAISFNKHCAEIDALIPQLSSIIPRKNRKDLNTKELQQSCHLPNWWFKN